jgi:hypothetical protein
MGCKKQNKKTKKKKRKEKKRKGKWVLVPWRDGETLRD